MLVNDNTVDIPIDKRVLYNLNRARQHDYRLGKLREQIETVLKIF